MNKRAAIIVSFGLSLVMILCFVYFLHGRHNRPFEKVRPTHTMLTDVDDTLREYVSPSKNFTASFPAVPQHASGFQNTIQDGMKVGYDIYVSQSRLGTTYMINVVRYPPSFEVPSAEKVLRAAVDEICASNPENSITETQMGTYKGFPALDFAVENPLAEIQGRVILKGTTLFVISVADENKDALEKHHEKFLSSFSFPD